MSPKTRRQALNMTAIAFAGLSGPKAVQAAIATPSAAEGPFYPTDSMRHPDTDNDLVKIAGLVREAGGEIFRLHGRVLDRSGRPIRGARVEIWQVDMNARYLHTGDRGGKPRDAAFQGFGHDVTDAAGNYQFRTIKPVAYPGRTPHIHVKAFTGMRELTTQFYLANHPLNAGDFLFQRMSMEEQRAVEMVLVGERADVEIVL